MATETVEALGIWKDGECRCARVGVERAKAGVGFADLFELHTTLLNNVDNIQACFDVIEDSHTLSLVLANA